MNYSEKQKETIIKCINSFGTHEHPAPDSVPLEGFTEHYIIQCLCAALDWEGKKREKSKVTS